MKAIETKKLVAIAMMMVAGASWGFCGAKAGEELTDWDDSVDGDAAPTVTEGDILTVSYSAVSKKAIPPGGEALLDADIDVAGGAFSGDYSDMDGISCMAMRGDSVDPGVDAELWLFGPTGNMYVKQLTSENSVEGIMNAGLGVWAPCNVSLSPEGWIRGGSEPSPETWANELANVQKLRLRICRQGSSAQSVSIQNFRLVGDGFVSDAATLTSIQAHFDQDVSNVDQLSQDQLAQDSDRDGVTDVEALAEGVDPGVALEIVSVVGDEVTLRWPVVRDKRYRLEKTGQGGLGFDTPDDVDTVEESTAATAGTKVLTYTESEPGPHFYRVIKQ